MSADSALSSESTPRSRYANFVRGTQVERDYGEKLRATALALLNEKGGVNPGDERLGQMVAVALSAASPADLRAGVVRGDVLARMEDLVKGTSAPSTARPVNIHSAEAAREDKTAGTGRIGRDDAPAAAMSSGERLRGLREISGPAAMARETTIAEATRLANDLGMPWAASNRELMALGRPAVQALHDVNIQRESFNKLKAAGFSDKDAVTVAKHAKRMGLKDGNPLFNSLPEGLDAVAGTDAKKRAELHKAMMDYMGAKESDREAMRAKLEGTVKGMATTPEQQKGGEKLLKDLGAISAQTNKAEVQAQVDAGKTADAFAAFKSLAPSGAKPETPAPGPTPARPAATPAAPPAAATPAPKPG